MNNDYRIFTGANKQQPENLAKLPEQPPPWRDFSEDKSSKQRAATYQAGEHEIEMVNAALLLRRPLLITGKPGTGKSSLAHAVAYELDLGDVLTWPITSKSTLQHGLYSYDALARLQDASLSKNNPNPNEAQNKSILFMAQQAHNERNQPLTVHSEPVEGVIPRFPKEGNTIADARDIGRYIRLGPMGTAFLTSQAQKPRVVLIDEIDKSDIDLPNDLLHLFEEGEFEIPELARLNTSDKETVDVYAHKSKNTLPVPKDGLVRCQSFPLVIMTSNGEREFPPAFLRRCLRLELVQPNEEKLYDIVNQHFGLNLSKGDNEQLTAAQREAKELIGVFFGIQQNKEIATDQLLNAVYLTLQDGMKLMDEDKNNLRQAIFAALTD